MLSNGRLGRKQRTEVKLFLGWACSLGLAGLVGPAVTTCLPVVPGEEHSSGQGQQAVPSLSQSATARSCLLGPSVQQGGLNSRESGVRNVPASDVQWSMNDKCVLLLNLLPASSAVRG